MHLRKYPHYIFHAFDAAEVRCMNDDLFVVWSDYSAECIDGFFVEAL